MECRLVEEKDAPAAVQDIYREIKKTLNVGQLPNWIKALGAHPALLKANWEKVKHTIVEGSIPALLKELIIFKVSVLNGSPYCSACHAHGALQLDKSLNFNDLMALSKGETLPSLPKPYQVALEVVPRVTADPHSFSDADLNALKDQGFTDFEVMELFAQGDIALMFNAITMLYRVPLDPDYRPVIDSSLHIHAA
jgi:AhpD family alkylhydroperoxidase